MRDAHTKTTTKQITLNDPDLDMGADILGAEFNKAAKKTLGKHFSFGIDSSSSVAGSCAMPAIQDAEALEQHLPSAASWQVLGFSDGVNQAAQKTYAKEKAKANKKCTGADKPQQPPKKAAKTAA